VAGIPLQCFDEVYDVIEAARQNDRRVAVSSQKDIFEKLIPFFKQNKLQTKSKLRNFEPFCEIANLIKVGKHLQQSGIDKILLLKSEMNKRTTGLA